MTWVRTECNLLWPSLFDARAVKSLKTLPPAVVDNLTKHLTDRLGRSLFTRLHFSAAQVIDVDDYFLRHPASNRSEYHLPTYQVAYKVVFSADGPVEYCAHIDLDQNGNVQTEIDLPDVSKHPERENVVPLQDILNLAHSLGVPTDKAYLDMKYDTESDSLEYLVSYYVQPTGGHNHITLHVRAHDPKEFYWFKGSVLTRLDPGERPNYGVQLSVGAPSIRAWLPIRRLRAACS